MTPRMTAGPSPPGSLRVGHAGAGLGHDAADPVLLHRGHDVLGRPPHEVGRGPLRVPEREEDGVGPVHDAGDVGRVEGVALDDGEARVIERELGRRAGEGDDLVPPVQRLLDEGAAGPARRAEDGDLHRRACRFGLFDAGAPRRSFR